MMCDMFPKKHVEYEQPAIVIPPKMSGGLSYAENVRYSSDKSSSDSESESDTVELLIMHGLKMHNSHDA